MNDLENLRIRLHAAAKQRLDALWKNKKISQQEAVEQILLWFVEQDDLLQSAILGQIGEERRREVARMVLERMARDAPAKSSRKAS